RFRSPRCCATATTCARSRRGAASIPCASRTTRRSPRTLPRRSSPRRRRKKRSNPSSPANKKSRLYRAALFDLANSVRRLAARNPLAHFEQHPRALLLGGRVLNQHQPRLVGGQPGLALPLTDLQEAECEQRFALTDLVAKLAEHLCCGAVGGDCLIDAALLAVERREVAKHLGLAAAVAVLGEDLSGALKADGSSAGVVLHAPDHADVVQHFGGVERAIRCHVGVVGSLEVVKGLGVLANAEKAQAFLLEGISFG